MKFTNVKLTYFKEAGKYYSEGELDLLWIADRVLGCERPVMFYEALKAVQELLNEGKRPGLVDGMHFDVLVTVYTEYGPLPHLFVRDEEGFVGEMSARVQRAHDGTLYKGKK